MSEYGRRSLLGEKRRHRRSRRQPTHRSSSDLVNFWIGNRALEGSLVEFQAFNAKEAGTFARIVDDTVRMNPDDPILIIVDDYQPWISNVLGEVINFTSISYHYEDPNEINREVQDFDTLQFPMRSDKLTKYVPWTFIVDQINIPEVYWWTAHENPPDPTETAELDDDVNKYRMRVGGWTCAMGAYPPDAQIEVFILFLKKSEYTKRIVTETLIPRLMEQPEYDQSRDRVDEIGLCWLLYNIYDIITNWQNVATEFDKRLKDAEANSHGETGPVKLRTRDMHADIDRIWELQDYLRYHMRTMKKLASLKKTLKHKEDQKALIWDQLEDECDELDQFATQLDGLKQRFQNLIDLEFNITNADQADSSKFIGILGALFLPVSFLASLFGITTVTWPVTLYVYIAIPLIIACALALAIIPVLWGRFNKERYPRQREHSERKEGQFTLLGQNLPGDTTVAGASKNGKGGGRMAAPRRKSGDVRRQPQPVDLEGGRSGRHESRPRSRARSRMSYRSSFDDD